MGHLSCLSLLDYYEDCGDGLPGQSFDQAYFRFIARSQQIQAYNAGNYHGCSIGDEIRLWEKSLTNILRRRQENSSSVQ